MMNKLHSKDIQERVLEWARKQGFTAPYGVLDGEHISKNGRKYKSVTFGYARTLDCSVEIYNSSFMRVVSSRNGTSIFKDVESLMYHLRVEYGRKGDVES